MTKAMACAQTSQAFLLSFHVFLRQKRIMTHLRKKFWETIDLIDMTRQEWEALCDGCGKCCLLKLENDTTDQVHYTNVACRLFDDKTCRCGNYPLRKQLVAGCVVLTPENIERNAHWMPSTCAYRLLEDGSPLPAWHPLVSDDPQSVQVAGISMHGKTLAEYEVNDDDLEDHIIEGLQ
jgi:uncharacterized cysteine cluster protein YcgN (CxxCxxCC family)